MSTRVKMCCIHSNAEVDTAVMAGADVLGFVTDSLGGLGILPAERIGELMPRVPPGVGRWLLTGRTDPAAIAAEHALAPADTIQLVRGLTAADRRRLRSLLPGVRLVQVVHVGGREAIAEAVAMAEADAVLLDSSDPGSGALGATGRTHDWSLSAEIVARCPLPVWLAGGLRVDNVGQAMSQVAPFGVDLCTGIRTDGQLDGDKARRFAEAVSRG